jgi:hypothetical protein
MNKYIVAGMLVTGSVAAEEVPYYTLFGEDIRYYAEAGLCTERKGYELEMCIDAYRAMLADKCIMKNQEEFCELFKEITKSEGLRALRLTVMFAEE